MKSFHLEREMNSEYYYSGSLVGTPYVYLLVPLGVRPFGVNEVTFCLIFNIWNKIASIVVLILSRLVWLDRSEHRDTINRDG